MKLLFYLILKYQKERSLDRKDLLKVHHIRFIQNYNKQKSVAKRWEKSQKNQKKNNLMMQILVLNNLMLIRKAIRHEIKWDDLIQLDVFKEFKSRKL